MHVSTIRRGGILPLTAFCLVALLGFLALAIDLGLVAVARSNAQTAADAAAMAGARAITGDAADNYGLATVPEAAIRAAIDNPVIGNRIEGGAYGGYDTATFYDSAMNPYYEYTSRPNGHVKVEVGSYTYQYNDANPSLEKFQVNIPRADPANEPWGAVRVTISAPEASWSFARVWGLQAFRVAASATAVHQPRDMAIIVDLSASMRGGSHLTAERWGARSTSMNPDDVFPKFGHYADYSTTSQAGAALQRLPTAAGPSPTGGSYLQGNNEYSDPSNLSNSNESGSALCDDFYQDAAGATPSLKAFSSKAAGQATAPGGDTPLRTTNNTATNPWAGTLEAVLGSRLKNLNFEGNGYTCSASPNLNIASWNGYTEGPGYWGQTFFLWPPEPLGATLPCIPANYHDSGARDWRQRFFLKVNTTDSNSLSWLDDNNLLFDSSGNLRAPGASATINGKSCFYRINYAAILYWLRTCGSGAAEPKGPMPAKVRAGRICYYDSIPDPTADNTLNATWWTTATLGDTDQRFWRDYIDYVLGVQRTGADAYNVICNSGSNSSGCGPLFAPGSTNNATAMAGWPATAAVYSKPTPCAYAVGYTTAAYLSGHSGDIAFAGNPSGSFTPAAFDYVIFGRPQRSPQPLIYCIKNSPAPTSSAFRLTAALNEDVPANTLVTFIGGAQTVNTAAAGSGQIDQAASGAGGVTGSTGYKSNWDPTPGSGNVIKVKSLNTYVPQKGDFFTINGSTTRYYTILSFNSTGAGKGDIKLSRVLYETSNIGDGWNVEFRRPTYLDYRDNPKRPRMQFWFGPMTFVDFIGCENLGSDYLRWPGTLHEAPNWQCKIGLQAAIKDIQQNHPNDFVGLCYYSDPTRWNDTGKTTQTAGQHNRPWVSLGRDYTKLKNALWYPQKVVNGQATEINFFSSDIVDVPRARGGTCPTMGFMLAYNMLSSSVDNLRTYASPQPGFNGDAGGRGRRGARKLIVHVTDGIANRYADAALTGSGADAYYPIRIKYPNNPAHMDNEFPINQATSGTDNAQGDIAGQLYRVAGQICQTTDQGGFSTSRQKVLIHCLAYGSMFGDSYTYTEKETALTILQRVQYIGSTATTTDWRDFPSYKRIAGTSSERITKMQEAFTKIMQDGVQVTLVE